MLHLEMVHIRDRNMKHLKVTIKEFEINLKNKNTRNLYKSINELKKCYQSWSNLEKIRRAKCMQIPTLYWIGGRITFFKYWIYFGLMILARLKYIELEDLYDKVEVAIEKLRRHKWPCIDQIAAEFYSSRWCVSAYWNT